jgi:hypothetical protein
MVRLQVSLSSKESEFLAHWAAEELRDPRDQIRLVLRREMECRGFLPSEGVPDQPATRLETAHAGAR